MSARVVRPQSERATRDTRSAIASAVERLVRSTVGLQDEAMGRPWAWGVYDEEGLRFALLMTQHQLRELSVRLEAARHRAGLAPDEVERIRAQYHDAYRDLTGLLAGVRDNEIDREPAESEWSVREALAHMMSAIYGFSAVLRLALEAHGRGQPQPDPTADRERWAAAKGQPAELATGDRRAVLDELASLHIRALREMAGARDEDLEHLARFWDGEMPIRFRLHRFEAHLRQHTIQIEKTLLAIGHPPTEAERLVRLVHRALGDVESAFAPGVADEEVARLAGEIDERAKGIAAARI